MSGNAPKVKLETSFGDIVLELFEKDTPETVKNFLEYVDSGHYDGTIFHRVIGNFMIQGPHLQPSEDMSFLVQPQNRLQHTILFC